MHTGRGVGPGVHSEPPFWEREVIGGGISDSTIRKSDGVFLQAHHCDHCAISNHFAAICDRILRRSNQQGVDHFGANFRKERVDRCKPNFRAIWQRHGVVVCKEIVSISSAVWAQCTNVTYRQTWNRQIKEHWNSNTNKRNRCQRRRLIMT